MDSDRIFASVRARGDEMVAAFQPVVHSSDSHTNPCCGVVDSCDDAIEITEQPSQSRRLFGRRQDRSRHEVDVTYNTSFLPIESVPGSGSIGPFRIAASSAFPSHELFGLRFGKGAVRPRRGIRLFRRRLDCQRTVPARALSHDGHDDDDECGERNQYKNYRQHLSRVAPRARRGRRLEIQLRRCDRLRILVGIMWSYLRKWLSPHCTHQFE